MSTTIAASTIATADSTSSFDVRYAEIERPTARSRLKIGSSFTISRTERLIEICVRPSATSIKDATAEEQAVDAVGHAHDDAAAVGELAQQLHDVPLEAGVEPRRRLVEEQQR